MRYVCNVDDFGESARRVVVVDEQEIGIFRLDDGYYAWLGICPHQGGPVCRGKLFKRVVDIVAEDLSVTGRDYHESDVNIICPWHGAEFDVRTGRHPGNPSLALTRVPLEVRDGDIYVGV